MTNNRHDEEPGFIIRSWRAVVPVVTITAMYLLLLAAYTYPDLMAQIGQTVIAPPVVQDSLRALVIVQIGRAFTRRWREMRWVNRLGWFLLACGVTFNLARGHWGVEPLTVSFALLLIGEIIVTWWLMVTPSTEVELRRKVRRQAAEHEAKAALLNTRYQKLMDTHRAEMARASVLVETLLQENDDLGVRCAKQQDTIEVQRLLLDHKEKKP